MPKGELRFSRNTVRVSATPSWSASRSSVMRFGLGTPAPARPMTFSITQPRRPLESSGLGGALVSATSTSPLGNTYSQRGWSRPSAKAATWVPAAAVGLVPAGQPMAGAMFTVGISVLFGSGNCGEGPVPSDTFRVELSPQAARLPASMISKASLVLCMVFSWMPVRVEVWVATMVQVQGQLLLTLHPQPTNLRGLFQVLCDLRVD